MDKILNLIQVTLYLEVHPATIFRLVKIGEIPAFKLGSEWRFKAESIDQWIVEREKAAGQSGLG